MLGTLRFRASPDIAQPTQQSSAQLRLFANQETLTVESWVAILSAATKYKPLAGIPMLTIPYSSSHETAQH